MGGIVNVDPQLPEWNEGMCHSSLVWNGKNGLVQQCIQASGLFINYPSPP